MKSFDDDRLRRLANRNWLESRKIDEKFSRVGSVINKETLLDNEERNLLLEFLEKSQPPRPLSMSTMKREILNKIGHSEDRPSWTNTVSRDELAAIYQFVTKLP